MLQGGEVHRGLPFAQVVDQHVSHRSAADAVAVDQLLAAGLTAAGEHLDRRGGVLAPAAAGVQQLVEQRAAGVQVPLPGRRRQAVSNSRQSPTRTSPTVPPLAAMITAIRINACCPT